MKLMGRNRSGFRARVEVPRVLVVDDEPDNCELLVTLLRDRGYDARSACDGNEAITTAIGWRPDVIIMDIAMPELDGWEATRRIRASAVRGVADSVIIVLTAFADSASRRRSYEAGCDIHLVKPVRPDELVAQVAAVLARPTDKLGDT